MLNDAKITELALQGELIAPFSQEQLQPHSYDARLGNKILIPYYDRNPVLTDDDDPTPFQTWEMGDLNDEETVIRIPHLGFALASTQEYLKLPQNVVGFVCGKSTIGRNGLQVENAGLIDAGFEGTITLELFNMAPWPIRLRTGMPICQMYFFDVDSPAYKDYKKIGHYNGQRNPTKPVYSI